MALKVEFMEKATIKPSSQTSLHLKTFKLSLIDQFIPLVPASVILFYSPDQQSKTEDQLDLLKRSLSKTLTHFYQLAGRINDNQYIDCNDSGVNFVKTHVISSQVLSQIVKKPKAEQLAQLLPTDDDFMGLGPKVLLSIQANVFDCGGIALGVHISHKVADASSLSMFLCNWASIARGVETTQAPELNNTSFFPPLDYSPPLPTLNLAPNPNLVCKRFIFGGSDVDALKSETSSIQVPIPTKVEAVMALIWWCCMRADPCKLTTVAKISVNLRRRMVPPLSLHFGNILTFTTAESEQSEPVLKYIVVQLRESIKKVDRDYCKKLGSQDGFWAYHNSLRDVYKRQKRGEVEVYSFTSWCKFPFYEIDFGWGKPIWTCFGEFSGRKLVALMDTKYGNGVEAWVTLDKAHMSTLESDPHFLSYTTINEEENVS